MAVAHLLDAFRAGLKQHPLVYRLGGFIVLVHFILATYGIEVINIDGHQQLIFLPETGGDFWKAVFYQHGNPPGLSLLFHLCRWLGGGDPYRTLTVVMPLLHAGSLAAFYFGCQRFNLSVPGWVYGLLFLNPLLFLYFKYPFYCTFLFFTACCLIYLLSRLKHLGLGGLALVVGLVSLNSLMRTSWHIAFAAVLAVVILGLSQVRYRWWLLLILVLPLSVYVKNYALYGVFSSSSWMGANIANTHLPWPPKPEPQRTLGTTPPNGLVAEYAGLYNENDPRIHAYKDVFYLNQGKWNDIRYLVISEGYGQEVKERFTWRWSANAVLMGYFLSMRSPASYFLLSKERGGITLAGKPIWNYDWLCPTYRHYSGRFFFGFIDMPELYHQYKPWEWVTFLTTYAVAWLAILILFGFSFLKLPATYRIMYLIMGISLSIFIVIDNAESERMRMEVEPFFYFFALVVVSRWRTGHWPWQTQNAEAGPATHDQQAQIYQ